ncbi:hypothetical protein D3C73_1567620 [compost metagenome]
MQTKPLCPIFGGIIPHCFEEPKGQPPLQRHLPKKNGLYHSAGSRIRPHSALLCNCWNQTKSSTNGASV